MNIPNYGILNPTPSEPAGYVNKDETWAAVPCGNEFIIIHNGKQVHHTKTLSLAKTYINKQTKSKKTNKTKSSSKIDSFFKD